MKETVLLIVVLTLVAAISGVLLAVTDHVTRDPIRAAARQELLDSLGRVLPPHDNMPDRDLVTAEEGGRRWTFHVARQGGRYAGAAFQCSTDKGYSGTIDLLVGVADDDTVCGLVVLRHSETPGLGAKIALPEFTRQFAGRSLAATRWAVAKDGGDIQAISGATISPRAVTAAVREGLDVYARHRGSIAAPGQSE